MILLKKVAICADYGKLKIQELQTGHAFTIINRQLFSFK
ncbi:hypothetical protein B4113_1766 [Geobacillus sp. B4113_201601]|nr:hypothetical protein B4113_1766 [Geobacillus sp. B4113_201601]